MPCADVATAKAKAATAINLIMSFLPCFRFANHALSRSANFDSHQPRDPWKIGTYAHFVS
jgi:hypothetical protein